MRRACRSIANTLKSLGRLSACPTGEGLMDLRVYYQKIRELERSLAATHPVVVSLETPDGGRAGVKTEVSAPVAARMVVDGRARLATEDEAKEFRERKTDAKRLVDQLDTSRRMQVSVVSESDIRAPKRKQ